jgi:hypothetical protein
MRTRSSDPDGGTSGIAGVGATAIVAAGVVLSLVAAGCGEGPRMDDPDAAVRAPDAYTMPTEATAEACRNGVDDDADSLLDCDDPDCAALTFCTPPPNEAGDTLCDNGIDDDEDGAADCLDSGCARARACLPPEGGSLCANRFDDDRDGAIDCDDTGCAAAPACATAPEAGALCANFVDDDLDGQIDCEDPSCADAAACRLPETSLALCSNRLDDDRDGLTDCDDPGCDILPSCLRGTRCGPVPTTGRCATPTSIEVCAVSTGDGGANIVTFDCRPGETCRVDGSGASCVFAGICREGTIECLDSSRVRVCTAGAWESFTCPRSCVSTVLGDGCAPDAPTRTTTGVLRYQARGRNAEWTDWGPTFEALAQRFLVLSMRSTATSTELFDATVTTEGEEGVGGRFSLRVPTIPTADDYLVAAAVGVGPDGSFTYVVADPGWAPSLTARDEVDDPPAPALWSWSTPILGRIDGDPFLITTAMGSGAARVFDYARYVHTLLTSHFAGRATPTLVVWTGLGTTWSCGACAAPWPTSFADLSFDSQIWIAGGTDEGYWADAVTAHELGHFMMGAYGVFPGEAGAHILGIPVQPGMAWSEGWATFVSSDVRNDSVYFDKQRAGAFWFDVGSRLYETGAPWLRPDATAGLTQVIDENEVATMLWQSSGVVSRAALWDALASPRMTSGPFERGYTRRVWTDPLRPESYTDTGVSAMHLADYFDALRCEEALDAETLDLITEPLIHYPYPSRSPLCR